MMMNNTLAQLRELKLVGMATAVEEQLSSTASTTLSFEERLALMVDREVHQRADKRHAALLKRARLKYPQACIEDVDGRAGRGFERPALMSLALSRWVEDGTAILVPGPTGSGKSWLACALAQHACQRGRCRGNAGVLGQCCAAADKRSPVAGAQLGEVHATLLTFKIGSDRPVLGEQSGEPAVSGRPRAVLQGALENLASVYLRTAGFRRRIWISLWLGPAITCRT